MSEEMNDQNTGEDVFTLDLSAPVDDASFTRSLTGLWAAAQELADDHDWCQAWFPHAARITPAFAGGELNVAAARHASLAVVDPSWIRDDRQDAFTAMTGEHNRDHLEHVRKRVLYFVTAGDITLAEANALLAAAGMAAQEPAARQSRYRASTSVVLAVTPGTPGFPAVVLNAFIAFLKTGLPEGITAEDAGSASGNVQEIAQAAASLLPEGSWERV